MVVLLEGRHLQFFVHKKLDPSSYIWAMPQIYWVLSGSLNLLFCAGFVISYFSLSFYPINMEFGHRIPRVFRYSAMTFLSHQACYSGLSRISGSLYSLKAKGSFCLLVKWAETALCCFSKAKGSICLLVKGAVTAFWLARQYAYNRVHISSMMYMLFDSPFIIAWMKTWGWTDFPISADRLHPSVYRFHNINTFIRCFNSGPASQTVAQYWTNIVYLVWTVETFQMLQLQ